MLEGDDLGGRAFVLFLRPHPGAFRQLMCPHPREFAHSFQKNANARGLAPGGGGGMGTAGIDSVMHKGGQTNGPIFQMSSASYPSIMSYINLLYVI